MLTLKYLRYWHTRYNKLIFGGVLRRPAIKIEPCLPHAVGYCEATVPPTIYIDPTLTREEVRRVLLHEMIHQWQAQTGLPLGHGLSFTQWKDQCERVTGLPWWP